MIPQSIPCTTYYSTKYYLPIFQFFTCYSPMKLGSLYYCTQITLPSNISLTWLTFFPIKYHVYTFLYLLMGLKFTLGPIKMVFYGFCHRVINRDLAHSHSSRNYDRIKNCLNILSQVIDPNHWINLSIFSIYQWSIMKKSYLSLFQHFTVSITGALPY